MPARNETRRKILLFALVFLPVFVACLWLYPRAQPVYQKAVVGAIDVALHRLDPPMRIEIREDGGWATFAIEPDGTERPYWSRPGKNLTLFFLGLALLPALLIATPVGWRRRLGLLGAGFLLLYALHVLAGLGLVLSIRCLANDPSVLICKWAKTIGNTFGQVTAFVVWGALTWQVWFPRAESPGGAVESRSIGGGVLVRNPGFTAVCVLAVALLAVAHAGSFSNEFHRADKDVIVDNLSVRSLGNTGKFFTDAGTFSTVPANAAYRPLLSFSYALDFWAGPGLQKRQFHQTQFALLLAVGIFAALFFHRLYDLEGPRAANRWVALAAASLLCVHVAITSVVNDFTARHELIASLAILIAFWIYLAWPERRRFHLYLLPMLAGMLASPAAFGFAPLLVAFAWLFEERRSVRDLLRRSGWPRFGAVLLRCAPALILGSLLMVWAGSVSGAAGSVDWRYLLSRPYTWLHQLRWFFLPTGLTADPGWSRPPESLVLTGLLGLLFLVALVLVVDRLSRVPVLRPAAFGLVWFAVGAALCSRTRVPPESAVARPSFLAYVGLACASAWLIAAAFRRLHDKGVPGLRWVAAGLAVALLTLNIGATRQRHEVWRNDRTLWADAIRHDPESARGRLNYGRVLLAEHRLVEAQGHLEFARSGLTASPLLELELGRAAAAASQAEMAEKHFVRAVELGPGDPENRHVYAYWLTVWGRGPEAIEQLEIAAESGTSDVNVHRSLMNLYAASGNEAALRTAAERTLEIASGEYVARAYLDGRIPVWASSESADAYVELARQSLDSRRWVDAATILRQVIALDPDRSRSLHQMGWSQTQLGFHEGAEASYRRALEIVPRSAPLWNDLGWALAQQSRFDEAIESFRKAIRIVPSYQLARDNLAWAQRRKREEAATD